MFENVWHLHIVVVFNVWMCACVRGNVFCWNNKNTCNNPSINQKVSWIVTVVIGSSRLVNRLDNCLENRNKTPIIFQKYQHGVCDYFWKSELQVNCITRSIFKRSTKVKQKESLFSFRDFKKKNPATKDHFLCMHKEYSFVPLIKHPPGQQNIGSVALGTHIYTLSVHFLQICGKSLGNLCLEGLSIDNRVSWSKTGFCGCNPFFSHFSFPRDGQTDHWSAA